MSQKERDAFVAGARWQQTQIVVDGHLRDWPMSPEQIAEALRRYSDETPAQEPVHLDNAGSTMLSGWPSGPVAPTPPEATRRWRCGLGHECDEGWVRCPKCSLPVREVVEDTGSGGETPS